MDTEEIDINNENDHTNAVPDIIQPIEKGTVHRICSGQVVLNLAIAVKELIENAIDAKATKIEVRLVEYGSVSIEVVDDGCGVRSENFEALALKHYTSKLREFTDLESVCTLGFRGEALSSLCALSELTVTTRHSSAAHGTKIVYSNGGCIASQTACARQVGTTVFVSKLFAPLPVRRKEFLKNLKRDFSKMCNLLYAYCLVSEGIKFTCTNQSAAGGARTTFVSTLGGDTVEENIICVFGPKQLPPLLDIATKAPSADILEEFKLQNAAAAAEDSNPFELHGLISSCAHGRGRSSSDRQFFYINSRPCEPAKVAKLVNEIYRRFNGNQYPFVYLNVRTKKNHVDVNVTPDKRQVYVENEKLLLATVKMSLLETFRAVPATYGVQNSAPPIADFMKNKMKNLTAGETSRGTKRQLDGGEDRHENVETKIACRNKANGLVQQSIKNFGKPVLSESDESAEEKEENERPPPLHTTNRITANLTALKSAALDSTDNDECKSPRKETPATGKETKINEHLEALKQKVAEKHARQRSVQESDEEQEQEEGAVEEKPAKCRQALESPSINSVSRNFVLNDTSMQQIKSKLAALSEMRQRTNKSGIDDVLFHSQIDPASNESAEKELQKRIDKTSFKEMSVVGQFNRGFIITALGSDLFIIDQHATDEKYNFETLQATTVLESQILVNPKPLQLTSAAENVVIENVEIFRKNGFLFRINENAEATKKILLTAIPMSKSYVFGKDDIDEMIFMLQDSPQTMCRPSRVRSMFASRACRSSVMIGSALSQSDMRRLVDHMGEIEQPWNCPHGRPTMRHLINLNLIQD